MSSFETERLICRPFSDSDAEDMLRNWAADPDIQNEYGEPVYSDITQVSELLREYTAGEKSRYRWAVVERSSGGNIGQIAFCKLWEDCRTAEIEYCIGKRFWGKGYAGECLEYARQIAEKENCYKMMLLTGSKKSETLRFYENSGYNSSDKTAFIQWLGEK